MNVTLLILCIAVTAFILFNELRYRNSFELIDIQYGIYTKKQYDVRPLINSKIVFIILTILFTWLCAVRDLRTNDAIPYYEYFLRLGNVKFFEIDGQYNLIFEYFAKICFLLFNNNYRLFFAAITMFNCLVVYYALGKIEGANRNVAFAVYICMFGLYYNYIVLRQGLAMSFVLLALVNLDKKKVLSALYLLLACFCHESVIVVSVVYVTLLFKKRKSDFFYYMLIIIAIVCYLTKAFDYILPYIAKWILSLEILPSQFNKYILYFTDNELVYYVSIMQLINYLLLFAYVLLRPKDNKLYDRYLLTMIGGQLLLGMFSLTVVVVRVADYFLLANLPLMAMLVNSLPRNKRLIFVGGYCLIVMAFYIRMISNMAPIVLWR